MTNTKTTTTPAGPAANPGGPAGPDPRPAFAAAIALAGETIANVRADQLDLSTPCTEYDVRELTGHMLFALRRFAAIAQGETDTTEPLLVGGAADPTWRDAWGKATHDIATALADDAVLDRMFALPFARCRGGSPRRST